MTAPVAPGYWWIAFAGGVGQQIALVSGDYPTAEEQRVDYIGGGFSSVAKCKADGFEFLKQVTEEV